MLETPGICDLRYVAWSEASLEGIVDAVKSTFDNVLNRSYAFRFPESDLQTANADPCGERDLGHGYRTC